MQKNEKTEQCWWAIYPNQPSTMIEIWEKTLPNLIGNLNNDHKNILTKVCVGYLVRVYTFLDMSRILKKEKVPGSLEDWRRLRLALLEDYKAVLGIKLMVLRCVARKFTGKKIKLEKELKANGLFPNDRAIYWYLEDMGLIKPILCVLKNIPAGYVPSIKKVQKDCTQVISNTSVFINRFAARKFKFIYEGNRFGHGDMVNELFHKIAQTYYHVTPFLSVEHAESTCKRAAHNHGIKLIKYWTHPDRARIRRESNGSFVNVIQTYSTDDTEVDSERTKLCRMQSNSDNMMELQEFSRTHQKDLPIVQLLTLKDDNDFIEFCGKTCNAQFTSTEDAYNFLEEEAFYKMIADYLNRPIDCVYDVVMELRERLVFTS